MHELSIVQGLCRQLDELATENGASRVHAITVEVGVLSNVIPELLRQAFLAFRPEVPLLAEAELTVREVLTLFRSFYPDGPAVDRTLALVALINLLAGKRPYLTSSGFLAGLFFSYLVMALGFLFVGIGAVGIVLPVLPTTPFLLLAAGCFAQSSERWHAWLINTRLFGGLIRDWEEHRCIARQVGS